MGAATAKGLLDVVTTLFGLESLEAGTATNGLSEVLDVVDAAAVTGMAFPREAGCMALLLLLPLLLLLLAAVTLFHLRLEGFSEGGRGANPKFTDACMEKPEYPG